MNQYSRIKIPKYSRVSLEISKFALVGEVRAPADLLSMTR